MHTEYKEGTTTGKNAQDSEKSLISEKSSDKKSEANIKSQINYIKTKTLLEVMESDRGLINPFSNKKATFEQHHDLLNFREIGSAEFNKYIEYYILKLASVHVQSNCRPLQQRRLVKGR